jgi:biopolymer transport protein ExbD
MRFKHRQQISQIPEINLIPMLNVMMGILAFFVMITMMLTTQQGVQVELPGNPELAASPPPDLPPPLIVELTSQGIRINEQPIANAELSSQMQTYLAANPDGIVALQADPSVPYEQVIQLLSEMKDIGGDRVSLAID